MWLLCPGFDASGPPLCLLLTLPLLHLFLTLPSQLQLLLCPPLLAACSRLRNRPCGYPGPLVTSLWVAWALLTRSQRAPASLLRPYSRTLHVNCSESGKGPQRPGSCLSRAAAGVGSAMPGCGRAGLYAGGKNGHGRWETLHLGRASPGPTLPQLHLCSPPMRRRWACFLSSPSCEPPPARRLLRPLLMPPGPPLALNAATSLNAMVQDSQRTTLPGAGSGASSCSPIAVTSPSREGRREAGGLVCARLHNC